jgi:hypothetical protein
MTRRIQAPEARRRRKTAAGPRPDADRLSLKPLTYEQAVRGLFAVKPDSGEADIESSEGKEVSEDG